MNKNSVTKEARILLEAGENKICEDKIGHKVRILRNDEGCKQKFLLAETEGFEPMFANVFK